MSVRVNPASGTKRVILPPFPSSPSDQVAMQALDAVCQDGLVKQGSALAAIVRSPMALESPGKVIMITVPDKARRLAIKAIQDGIKELAGQVEAVGFAELVMEDGVPYHSLHIENPHHCLHVRRCAFYNEKGVPVSLGCPEVSHLSTFTRAADGVCFWTRPLKNPGERVSPDTHTLIDKQIKRRRNK